MEIPDFTMSDEAIVRVAGGAEYQGGYVSREGTGEGYQFNYFVNDSAEYRITLITSTMDDNLSKADINAIDGGHETLESMVEVETVTLVE